ncbi:MAG TPA: hypothetical protein VFP46_01950 [Candidatus Paceibacterota bacterium]|nr:hypothetical protein [Candidatus Paceibacterota bacterium]
MKRLTREASGLTRTEYGALKKLTTPVKIQDFLDRIPMNWEKKGDTNFTPRAVLNEQKAHCLEGALLAAAALWIHGERPLVMNVSARMGKGDVDHVITLYKRGGRWGAISKTNHATIRFRDPVYKTLRELVLSYFHEWFMNTTGEKTLECYSRPLDLSRLGPGWITAPDANGIAEKLGDLPHYFLVPKGNWRYVRPADRMELQAGRLVEWLKTDRRT